MPIIIPPPSGQQPNVVDSRALAHLSRRFNKTFVIEHQVDVPDNQGGVTSTWAALATVPGTREALSAQERLARGVTEAVGYYTAFIAYRTDVDVRMRLNEGGRIFDIANVSDLGEQNLILGLDVHERFRA